MPITSPRATAQALPSVPTDWPDDAEHRRMLARALNGITGFGGDSTSGSSIIPFVQNGTNPRVRTVQAKDREIASGNDYLTYQDAINSRETAGGAVQFPAGGPATFAPYSFSVGLTLPGAVYLNGDGAYASFLRYSSANLAISASGTGNNSSGVSNLTIDVTQNGAACIDDSRFFDFKSVNLRLRSFSGSSQYGLYANITNTNWQSYFNTYTATTFDSLATAVYLSATVAQAANRHRYIAPTLINCGDGFNFQKVQGATVIGAEGSECTGKFVKLGANADRIMLIGMSNESNVGGTMFDIDHAANRTQIIGFKMHAGTLGFANGIGLRGFVVGDWDTGIWWSGSTDYTKLSKIYVDDDTGVKQEGVKSIGGMGATAVSVAGWAGKANDLTYGTTIATDASKGPDCTITVTDGVAFAISAPTNPGVSQTLIYMIRNTSGGAMGAITWNAIFKMSAWTNPANGFSRSVEFRWDGANWVQRFQATVDVTN